ncbi:uncharacterized protein LOC131179411 [Hevea brasiliensis]|uniref:uncharacterized protein LOC131179411 n=1 Tax=Hevea brasiliensis TaxID=3981 RepID=UPI0025D9029E|nr:uncharacterized protein LOC131179411 [Hevea brasiliensis]
MSWLINSMQPHIAYEYLLLNIAAAIWSAVSQTYSQVGNDAQVYELQNKEVDFYQNFQASCPEDAVKFQKLVEKERIYDFLTGLNMGYDQIRVPVLGKNPLPTLRQTYSYVQHEKSRRSAMIHSCLLIRQDTNTTEMFSNEEVQTLRRLLSQLKSQSTTVASYNFINSGKEKVYTADRSLSSVFGAGSVKYIPNISLSSVLHELTTGRMIGSSRLQDGLYLLNDYVGQAMLGQSMVCDACEFAKHTKQSYPAINNKASVPFMIIHSDIWGPTQTVSLSGYRWMPLRTLEFKSPLEVLQGKNSYTVPPKVFGCVCFIHKLNSGKLEPRALKYIFVGYSSTQKEYRCYHPPLRKYFVSMDVTFKESESYFHPPLQGEHRKEETDKADLRIYTRRNKTDIAIEQETADQLESLDSIPGRLEVCDESPLAPDESNFDSQSVLLSSDNDLDIPIAL